MTKLTPKRRSEFLDTLRATCNVTLAAEAIGMSRGYMYEVKASDKIFSVKWENALDEGIDRLEAEAHRRGFQGVDEPVFYQGNKTATVKKYSDTLAIFLLKAHRPDRYRENVDHNVSGNLTIEIVRFGENPDTA